MSSQEPCSVPKVFTNLTSERLREIRLPNYQMTDVVIGFKNGAGTEYLLQYSGPPKQAPQFILANYSPHLTPDDIEEEFGFEDVRKVAESIDISRYGLVAEEANFECELMKDITHTEMAAIADKLSEHFNDVIIEEVHLAPA